MTIWEYAVVTNADGEWVLKVYAGGKSHRHPLTEPKRTRIMGTRDPDLGEVEEALDRCIAGLGIDGWELVGVMPSMRQGQTYGWMEAMWFKRPREMTR